jgi:membrane associated rhomboid family serine protease
MIYIAIGGRRPYLLPGRPDDGDGVERREPIFNVAGVVLAVLALLVGVHVLRLALPSDAEQSLTIALAFVPARLTGLAQALPGGQVTTLTSFVTHMTVHGDWAHLGLNSAWLLAFGSAVARRFGPWRFLAYAIACGVAGILLYLPFHWREVAPVVGASGAVSGLMAGALLLIHGAMSGGLGPHALDEMQRAPARIPLASLWKVLRDRQVLTLIAVWALLNFGLGVAGGVVAPDAGGIAWEAHLGGFAAGLLLFGALDPGVRLPDEIV